MYVHKTDSNGSFAWARSCHNAPARRAIGRRAEIMPSNTFSYVHILVGLAITGISLAAAPAPTLPASCLESGDGYLRASLGGAIEAKIDWPNSGTRCQGEPRDKPPGVRLSFQRAAGGSPDLLFVFGITGVREGRPARAAGVNLTVIVQGTNRIYG